MNIAKGWGESKPEKKAVPKDRRCVSCIARLYEQDADEQCIGQYVRRFEGWVTSAWPHL